MTPEQFAQLAKTNKYNKIPIMRQVLADMETPLSTYKKLADTPYSYLFESIHGGEKWGRYSIIGLGCDTILRVFGNTLTIEQDGVVVKKEFTADPLQAIESYYQEFSVPQIEGLPKFFGGMVGYFGYDCVSYIEPCLNTLTKKDQLNCPDILLMVSEQLVVFDQFSGKLHIIVHADPSQQDAYAKAQQQLDILGDKLKTILPNQQNHKPQKRDICEDDFISGFGSTEFKQSVEQIKEYIFAGDVMQVVLSQRLSIPFQAPPIDLYRALRCLNPSPYMFYLNLKEFYVIGSSPEILVRLEDQKMTVRPLAGTRHRKQTEAEDLLLEKELLTDAKECAEHLMLIDLGRNDIGRVAKTGTVKLTEKMNVERYSHVMHIVSNVIGILKEKHTMLDVFRATFPAGTVSGAPKIRAIEIIDELEPVKRGIYAGAVGYLSWNNNMDIAIAIRTAVIKDKVLHVQAGAGIVADSIAENEWQETMNKARAIFRAVLMAENGLN